jgi:hypothetical protein
MPGELSLITAASPSPCSRFVRLAPELTTHISLLHEGVAEVLSTRLVSCCFEEPAALAVKTLQTVDGQLPPGAWSKFKQADGVVLLLDPGLAANDLSTRLVQVVTALPARLRRVTLQPVVDSKSTSKVNIQPASLDAFFAVLANSKCAGNIERLVVSSTSISPQAAKMALQHFTGLKVFKAVVSQSCCSIPDVTISTFPRTLESLSLSVYAPNCSIDTCQLQQCSNLQTLSLLATTITNVQSIAACHALRTVSVVPMHDGSCTEQHRRQALQLAESMAQVVKQLPALSSLSMPQTELTEQQWRAIAAVSTLTHLDVASPLFSPHIAAPAAVTDVAIAMVKDGLHFSGNYEGALTHMLPRAKQLVIISANSSYRFIAEALRGHEQLHSLDIIGVPMNTDDTWPQLHLRTISKLRTFVIEGATCSCLEDIIADVAGCSELEDISIVCDAHNPNDCNHLDATLEVLKQPLEVEAVIRPAAVQALISGACRSSLQRVVLIQSADSEGAAEGVMVGVPDLAALLQAGMDQLREVAMDVNLPVTLQAAPGQQQQLAQLFAASLQQCGVAAGQMQGFQVQSSWSYDVHEGQDLPVVVGMVGEVKVHARLWQVQRG